jgi:hypothetical protein
VPSPKSRAELHGAVPTTCCFSVGPASGARNRSREIAPCVVRYRRSETVGKDYVPAVPADLMARKPTTARCTMGSKRADVEGLVSESLRESQAEECCSGHMAEHLVRGHPGGIRKRTRDKVFRFAAYSNPVERIVEVIAAQARTGDSQLPSLSNGEGARSYLVREGFTPRHPPRITWSNAVRGSWWSVADNSSDSPSGDGWSWRVTLVSSPSGWRHDAKCGCDSGPDAVWVNLVLDHPQVESTWPPTTRTSRLPGAAAHAPNHSRQLEPSPAPC